MRAIERVPLRFPRVNAINRARSNGRNDGGKKYCIARRNEGVMEFVACVFVRMHAHTPQ